MRAALADETCRAIVLTGSEGCFSAGGDVSRFATMPPERGRQLVRDQREFLHLVMRGNKAVIAAVEGFSYGARFGLAMACDHIVAARDAQRSEEHTSEHQSLMRISYSVLCLKKKN